MKNVNTKKQKDIIPPYPPPSTTADNANYKAIIEIHENSLISMAKILFRNVTLNGE